ncbi:MAG: hypothetical protein ABJO02_01135 [Reichenbachiella sp.]|uniref:hypothetical protein n=1 Tax=Reichenbachiella sp. TaxID=2184521 RepID=UPI003297A8E2
MGTWGTAIKSNDAFADVYDEFYELYNKGGNPEEISKKLIESNWEILEIEEEKHNLWFAIALAQWETKSLDSEILKRVEKIIQSGDDLKIWKDLGTSNSDLKKRKLAIEKFLDKIKSERPKAKPRKKSKLKTPVFSTGDCITFTLENGNYGGAVIIGTDENPETGYNLVATTRLNQKNKPTPEEFQNSEVLIKNFGDWNDQPDIAWIMPDLFFKDYVNSYELVGSIDVTQAYLADNHSGEGYPFKPTYSSGWRMNKNFGMQLHSEESKPKPDGRLTIEQLINSEQKSRSKWNFFKRGS